MNKGTLRVLQVLSLFERRSVWGVTEVAKELVCTKNTAFHALDTLLKEGYLVRDVSGTRYQLGHAVLNLGRAIETVDIRSICLPYMRAIQKLTNETVFLNIIVGRHNVCIEGVRPQGAAIGYAPLSQPVPMHAGVASRVLLAHLRDDEIEQYIALASPLPKFTENTITSPRALRAEVKRIRSEGFARGLEDFTFGATYMAFPVLGPMERPLAAITVGGPKLRFTAELAESYIPEIRRILAELNQHSRMLPTVPSVRF